MIKTKLKIITLLSVIALFSCSDDDESEKNIAVSNSVNKTYYLEQIDENYNSKVEVKKVEGCSREKNFKILSTNRLIISEFKKGDNTNLCIKSKSDTVTFLVNEVEKNLILLNNSSGSIKTDTLGLEYFNSKKIVLKEDNKNKSSLVGVETYNFLLLHYIAKE